MKYSIDKKTGLKYREDTYDMFIIKEQRKEYNELFQRCKDHVVLDIGGNCGFFAYHCVKNGCKKVISYEPDPSNFDVLESQDFHKEKRSEYHNIAIGPENGSINLYINQNKNKGMHSIIKVNGRPILEVPVRKFDEIVKEHNPRIMKMDIEGAELFLNWDEFPNFIDLIAIEIHNVKGKEKEAKKLLQFIEKRFPIKLYYHEDISFGRLVAYIFVGCKKDFI